MSNKKPIVQSMAYKGSSSNISEDPMGTPFIPRKCLTGEEPVQIGAPEHGSLVFIDARDFCDPGSAV